MSSITKMLLALVWLGSLCCVEGVISKHPESHNVALGQSVNMSCESDWTFDQWMLNGSPISDGVDFGISSTSMGSHLQIKSFKAAEAGEYRCRFSNGSAREITKPGRVKYFYDAGMDMQPQDFDSYPVNGGSREVIAFECRATKTDDTVRPEITWQWCRGGGTYDDIVAATDTVSGGRRAGFDTHVYLQNGYTGYIQLLDADNPAYNGSQVRCKMSSPIAGDSTEYFSSCATITTHSTAPPPGFPMYRTIPPSNIHLTQGDTAVMACSVQYQNLTTPVEITFYDSNAQVVVANFVQLDGHDYGFEFHSNSLLLLDTTLISSQWPMHPTITYSCGLQNQAETHSTTFHLIEAPQGPITSNASSATVTVQEGEPLQVSFQLPGSSSEYTEHRVFFNGDMLSNSPSAVISTPNGRELVLTLPQGQESQSGLYQVELENLAGVLISAPLIVEVNVPQPSPSPSPSTTPASTSTSATETPTTSTLPTAGTTQGNNGPRLPTPNTTILIVAIVVPILIVLLVIFIILLIIVICICCNKDDEEDEEGGKEKHEME
jgi:hypothetical protein